MVKRPEHRSTVEVGLTTILDELGECLRAVDADELLSALNAIDQAKRVFVAGAGRSRLGVRGLAMRLMHIGKTSHVVGETTTPAIDAGDLLLVGSGSGRTASLQEFVKKAKEVSATVLLFTIDPESPLAERADHVVRVPGYSPRVPSSKTSAQPMGSLFEQSLFILLDCIVLLLLQRDHYRPEEMRNRHANLE